MLNTIRIEIAKFEKVILKRFAILSFLTLGISFLPYYYASDGFSSVWKSISNIGEVWNGLSGFHTLSIISLIFLAISPFLFLLSIGLIYSKMYKYDGTVIEQLFTSEHKLNEDKWFMAGIVAMAVMISSFALITIFQLLTGLVLIFSNEKYSNEFLPSFGYYLYFVAFILVVYLLIVDLKTKFNFKLFLKQLEQDLTDEFAIALYDYLERKRLIPLINGLAEVLGDDLNTIEVNVPRSIFNRGQKGHGHFSQNKNPRMVIREDIKFSKSKPKLAISYPNSQRKFEGFFFHEVPLTSSESLRLIVENTGTGSMRLRMKSEFSGIYITPSEVVLDSNGSWANIELCCTPRNDSKLQKASIKRGKIIFGYPYLEKFKEVSYEVGFSVKGYSSSLTWNPVIAALVAFVFTFLAGSISQLFIDPVTVVSNGNNLFTIVFAFGLFGAPILAYFIGKRYFPSFPTNIKALFIIPLISVILVQLGLLSAYKNNLFTGNQTEVNISESNGQVNAARGLVVREKTSTSSKKVGVLKDKTQVRIISFPENSNWLEIEQIETNGIRGFVSKKYILLK